MKYPMSSTFPLFFEGQKRHFFTCFSTSKIVQKPLRLVVDTYFLGLSPQYVISIIVLTWLERGMLIAFLVSQPSLLQVISPRNYLYLQEQVKAKIIENPRISVNRSRAVFAFFTVFGVLHFGIGQRDFGISVALNRLKFNDLCKNL